MAELGSSSCSNKRLLWRKFLVNEGKNLKPRILHHASVVMSPEQWDGLLLTLLASMCQTEIDISVNEKEESTMEIKRVGVDLAKNVFQLHGADRTGKTVWTRKLSRAKWLSVLFDTVPPGTEIGMEACAGAHHWARLLTHRGYAVKIIPPQFVTPFVKSNKNDANDAQAICEAMGRPNMTLAEAQRPHRVSR